MALLLALTVVLAGCTGFGGLGGGGGDGDSANTASGTDAPSDEATASETTNAADMATEVPGATTGLEDDSTTENSGETEMATSDDAGTAETDVSEGTTNGGSTDATESSGGATNGDDGTTGGAASVEPLDEVWYNFSENVYVFEVVDAENGSGTVTFEPNETDAEGTFASLYPIVSYEGDDSLEAAYTAQAEQTGDPTSPILTRLSVGGFFGFVDQENLTVGYERTNVTNGTEVIWEITGKTSYGGVGCYVTEVHVDGRTGLKTCNVPYTEDVIGILNYPPYTALYDENGEVVWEIKLVEVREADSES